MTSRTHTPEDVKKIMEPWRDSASDYERGFIDGMQKQMQSSVDKAVNAIKEALAQPEHEPVGRFSKFTDGIWREVTDGSAGLPLYTTPPQRKPLTDEEISRLWSQSLADTEGETWLPLHEFARAIEAAHGIKGEA